MIPQRFSYYVLRGFELTTGYRQTRVPVVLPLYNWDSKVCAPRLNEVRAVMLTRKQISKIARLREQVGELRPGFLHDGAASFEGPTSDHYKRAQTSPKRSRRKSGKKGAASVHIKLEYERDPETGETRIIQK